MASGDFLGVSAGVVGETCEGMSFSAGIRDKRNLTPFLPDTVNRIASITKPMTAIAIMQLYEKGVLDIDAPIQTYMPDFSVKGQKMTIRHILRHESGMSHYTSKLDAMSFERYESLTSAVDFIARRELLSNPGNQYHYSSFGYTVLGRIIEIVSGQHFEDYLSKHIWQVANMHIQRKINPDFI
jgi:CubicO group peptidase (beta-lactamase class C family)